MFNSHVHSQFSNDCGATGDEMCIAAIKKGMGGIAFTNHCNLDSYITQNSYKTAVAAAENAAQLREKYAKELIVTSGIEMGEALRKPDYAERILRAAHFDIVLLSVHAVIINNMPQDLAQIDFSKLPEDTSSEYGEAASPSIKKIITEYFRDLKASVINADFDVCAHLTLPLRYIKGKYKRNIDIREFDAAIDDILSVLIKRKKALELNTSELHRQLYDFMPDERILRRYRALGGELVTIGTDAHRPENIDSGFSEGAALLKSCGFDSYCRYENRKAIRVAL